MKNDTARGERNLGLPSIANQRYQPSSEIQQLLHDLTQFLSDYVVFGSRHHPVALALWTIHTHALDAADATPYPLVLSAEKRSGKSLLLEVLELVVARPWLAVNPTEAVLFRKCDAEHPTILMDEVDALFNTYTERTEPIRSVLNAGYRRGASVPRCFRSGSNWLVEDFDVFCPKVLTGIDNGKLPDTVRDRGFEIRLDRKVDEPVKRFRRRNTQKIGSLMHERCVSWAQQGINELRDLHPELPEQLHDRAAEVWEPLLAIADVAGAEWPDLAREAALELSGGFDVEEESLGIRLLADLQKAFEGSDVLSSSELCTELQQMDEAPWKVWGKGRPNPGLTPNDLARLLKRYKTIRPRTVRLGPVTTAKGYRREQFDDVWRRYLPGEDLPEPSQASQTRSEASSIDDQQSQGPDRDVSKNSEGPLREPDVTAVTFHDEVTTEELEFWSNRFDKDGTR